MNLAHRALVGVVFVVALLVGSTVGSTPRVDVAHAATPAPWQPDPLVSSVHEALWGTPRSALDRDEDTDARWKRLHDTAKAIGAAARASDFPSPLVPAAALVALGQHESTWAEYIGEDRCKDGPDGMQCDPDEHGKPRALGYWQLHRSACPKAWDHAPSAERLLIEAECAVNAFARAADRCFSKNPKGTIAGALAGYRGKCDTTDADLRARTWDVFHQVLEDGWPSPPLAALDWERRGGRRTTQEARRARELLSKPVGTWVELEPGALGALVTWHWHDFGGEARPRGWHRGVTLYAPRTP